MKRKICSIICLTCILFGIFSVLTSCGYGGMSEIVNAEINENGELVFIYNDGKEQNLGTVVGKDGTNGVDGKDGEDGKNGTLVADGVLQAEDILVSAKVNDNTTDITRQYHIIDMMLVVRVDDVVTLNILRGGEEKAVSITITEDCLTAY